MVAVVVVVLVICLRWCKCSRHLDIVVLFVIVSAAATVVVVVVVELISNSNLSEYIFSLNEGS